MRLAVKPKRVRKMSEKTQLPKAVRDWLAAIGRKGGEQTSHAKTAASRENGKLGGRPPKKARK
jgi:hypothetical protein